MFWLLLLFLLFTDTDTDTSSFKIEVGISVSGGVVFSIFAIFVCWRCCKKWTQASKVNIDLSKSPFLPFYPTYLVLSLKRNKRNELEQESNVCRDSLI